MLSKAIDSTFEKIVNTWSVNQLKKALLVSVLNDYYDSYTEAEYSEVNLDEFIAGSLRSLEKEI